MTHRKQRIGQLQRPGKRPENVTIIEQPRPVQTRAEAGAGINVMNPDYEPGNVKRYAAVGDDTTDSSAAVENALSGIVLGTNGEQRLPLIFPSEPGKYVFGDISPILWNDIEGTGATVEAVAGATTIFKLGREPKDLWRYRKMTGMYLRGNAQATDGVTFTDDEVDEPNNGPELAGRWVLDSVFFENCDKAIYKPKGNLGNIFRNVTTAACNFGYFAVDNDSPNIMHPGMDHFYGGRHAEHDLAAMYFSSDTQSTVGTILDGVVIEDNVAFGIYIDGWNLAGTALHLRSVVFENNNTGGADVDLGQGQGSETPRDIFMRDVDHAIITGSHVRSQGWEFVNSMVTMDGCFFDATSVLIRDSDSVVRCVNANLNGINGSADVIIESLTQQRKDSGDDGVTMVAQIPPRDNIVYSLPGTGVGVYSETNADWDVSYGGAITGTRTDTGLSGSGLYRHHNVIVLAADTVFNATELIPVLPNKWYVYTVNIMVTSGEVGTLDFAGSSTHELAVNLDSPLRNNVTNGEWVTLGGVTQYTNSDGGGNTRFKFARTAATATTFSLGPVQLIQFDTQSEAIDYFNSRSFFQGNVYEYSGFATTSSGTVDVVFQTPQPDALYNIEMMTDSDATLFYTNKSATGFTINNGSATNNVNWRVYRRDSIRQPMPSASALSLKGQVPTVA
jgi:hypothetical protein